MTRPMPYTEAPPHPGRSPKFSGDDVGHEERLAAREAWDDARWKYTESIVVGRDKRLKDAECAAEYWRAASDFRDRLRHGLAGDDLNPEWGRRLIWHRFAAGPHALEES